MDGEDLLMRRRRANELKRQEELRRKKAILYGRDLDGGEGGNEFVVPHSAHLSDVSKYHVSCGLRSRGVVDNFVSAGLGRAAPEAKKVKRMKEEKEKRREGARVFGFLGRNAAGGSP